MAFSCFFFHAFPVTSLQYGSIGTRIFPTIVEFVPFRYRQNFCIVGRSWYTYSTSDMIGSKHVAIRVSRGPPPLLRGLSSSCAGSLGCLAPGGLQPEGLEQPATPQRRSNRPRSFPLRRATPRSPFSSVLGRESTVAGRCVVRPCFRRSV